MFNLLVNSLTQTSLKPFFEKDSNLLPEFRSTIPTNRIGGDDYENRLSKYLVNQHLKKSSIKSQCTLKECNTFPSVCSEIIIDAVKYIGEEGEGFMRFLKHDGRPIREFWEHGHGYLSQPYFNSANKILMDFAKVMIALKAIHCRGYFYQNMIISNPHSVEDSAYQLFPRGYRIEDFLNHKDHIHEDGYLGLQNAKRSIQLNMIIDEIRSLFSAVNPHIQVKVIDPILYNPRPTSFLHTHFILVGPIFLEDCKQIWANLLNRPDFQKYEIYKNPNKQVLKEFYTK